MKNIVIIDDEEDVRSVLEIMVSEVTEDFVSFEAPDSAIDYIKSNHQNIALIISDHRMPGKSGVDVYQAIEEFKIPFALCTGMHPGEVLDKIVNDNFYVLEKPFNEEELINIVESSLKN